jgi:hypothetical protein
LVIVGATAADGQVADSARVPAGRIIGVFDAEAGTPLEGVRIVDAFSGSYVVTTQTGTARLDFLTFRGAAAFVELRKLGYEPKQIVVSRADTVAITETMQRLTILPQVTTTAKYRIDRDPGRWEGFEDRCRSGSVTCIRSEDLEQKPAANIADFLVHAPGVTMGACSGVSGRNTQCGHIAMKPTVSPPAFCLPTFFVDGIEWSLMLGPPVDLTPGRSAEGPYTPTNVKAVEIYPPERNRPLRFTGDPTCGVIVVWTK